MYAQWQKTLASYIVPTDLLLLQAGDVVPCDCIILQGRVLVGTHKKFSSVMMIHAHLVEDVLSKMDYALNLLLLLVQRIMKKQMHFCQRQDHSEISESISECKILIGIVILKAKTEKKNRRNC